jgi:transposase-like protein
MKIEKVAPLSCPECKSTKVNRQKIINRRKETNSIISCFDCRKDYSMKDMKATEHKNQPFYGRSGVMVSRYEMGDYLDHRGI